MKGSVLNFLKAEWKVSDTAFRSISFSDTIRKEEIRQILPKSLCPMNSTKKKLHTNKIENKDSILPTKHAKFQNLGPLFKQNIEIFFNNPLRWSFCIPVNYIKMEAHMKGSVLNFLKAEWKVSDTGSVHWASSLMNFLGKSFSEKCIALLQVSDHLAKWLQRKSCFRNWPIRNKTCLWQPNLLIDRDEMSNLYRGSP
jgi:hypothetical protein